MPAGCWDNQGLVFRVTYTISGKGRTLDRVVAETWPEATRVAVVYRGGVSQIADAVVQAFVARTGEWMPPHARAVDDYSCSTVDGQYSCSDLRTTIKALVASDPQVIVIMLYLERLRRFLEDYAALKSEWTAAEGRPPGYDGINFVVDGTDIPKGGWDKTNPKVSAVVRQVMAERVVVAQPSWDPASEGFVRWEQLAGVGVAYHQRYVYDAAMLLVLSITAADSLEPDAIKAQYREVANPGPGKTEVVPGQYRQARELLLAGEKIHYTGASGPVDIGPSGNVTSTTYELWRLRPDGNAETIRHFQSVE